MFPQGRKYFRFYFGFVWAFVFVSPSSSTHQVSVPKGCAAVASYAFKTDWKKTNLVDAKLLKNSISCIQELYKIWGEVQNMPQEVRDFVCKASHPWKSTSSIVEREELSSFVPLYLLCRTFDLYDRVMQLDINFKTYRKEFELLQAELHQVTESIDKETMSLWEHLDSVTLQVITSKQIQKLRSFHATLRQLAQVIYEDIKKAHDARKWAGVFGVASTAVCVGSIFIGNVPGRMACAASGLSGISFIYLTSTIQKLTSLHDDMTIMANEIEEHRIPLEQQSILGSAFGHVGFPRRSSETFDSSCAFTSLQSSCRQQSFCSERPAATTPLTTSSTLNLTPHPYMHSLAINSLTPLSSTNALSHPCHAPRPLPHPGYIGHPNEHTIHHTPSHLTTHAHMHSTLNGYPDSLRQDCRPDYGLGRGDFSKPLTISTTFHAGFPGNPPPYPYH